jgi:uncharacterized membrane protein YhaH (DUF805 family)
MIKNLVSLSFIKYWFVRALYWQKLLALAFPVLFLTAVYFISSSLGAIWAGVTFGIAISLPYFIKFRSNLTFKGRLNRSGFWRIHGIALLSLFLIMSPFILSSFIDFKSFSYIIYFIASSYAGILVTAVTYIYVLLICTNVQRFHDRNKSGIWYLVFVLFTGVLGSFDENKTSGAAGVLFGLVLLAWYFIEIGALRGTVGSNEYGNDPLVSESQ